MQCFQQALDEDPGNQVYIRSIELTAKAPELHVELHTQMANQQVAGGGSSSSGIKRLRVPEDTKIAESNTSSELLQFLAKGVMKELAMLSQLLHLEEARNQLDSDRNFNMLQLEKLVEELRAENAILQQTNSALTKKSEEVDALRAALEEEKKKNLDLQSALDVKDILVTSLQTVQESSISHLKELEDRKLELERTLKAKEDQIEAMGNLTSPPFPKFTREYLRSIMRDPLFVEAQFYAFLEGVSGIKTLAKEKGFFDDGQLKFLSGKRAGRIPAHKRLPEPSLSQLVNVKDIFEEAADYIHCEGTVDTTREVDKS